MAHITLNKTGTRWLVAATSKTNHITSAVPMVRYNSNAGCWAIPVSKLGSQSIDSMIRGGGFTIDENTIPTLMKHLAPPDRMIPPVVDYPFKMKPAPVQVAAYEHLWGMEHFSLSCEVGLGKAKMILDLAGMFKMAGRVSGMLILMPPSIQMSFAREVEKHMAIGSRVTILDYKTKRSLAEFEKVFDGSDTFDIVIMALSKLWTITKHNKGVARGTGVDMAERFLKSRDCFMAVDESHGIMNPEAKQTQNAIYLGAFAKHRLVSSGTQVSTNIMNIFTQYYFLDPSIIGAGTLSEFKSNYCLFGGFKNKDVVGYKNVDALMQSISPYTFVARQRDWLNLPELTTHREYVDLHPKQEKVIRGIVSQRSADVKAAKTDMEIDGVLSSASTHIQLVAGGHTVVYDEHDPSIRTFTSIIEPSENPKVIALLNLIDDLDKDAKIILWTHFVVEQQMLYDVLSQKYDVLWLKSGMSAAAKDAAVENFKMGTPRILLAHQQVAGTGLTINEAKVAIWYSSPRDPISRTQAKGRNYRFGQTAGVLHIDILADGTYDAKILNALEEHSNFDKALKEAVLSGDSSALDI